MAFRLPRRPQRVEPGGALERALPPLFGPDEPRPVAMVTALGLPAEAMPEIIAVTGRRLGRRNRLVYVTSVPDFVPFLNAGAVFEYLPHPSGFEELMDAALYFADRRTLLLAKWAPRLILAYGTPLEAFVAEAEARPLGSG